MEEIEYLEEYEDLVLPALNSAAAAATASSGQTKLNKSENQTVNDDGDDSSSSLDQDIFNCLFDDNSDDDDEDFNNEQGGEKLIKGLELLNQDQKNKVSAFDKEANKVTSTPKPKTFTTKASSTTISINKIPTLSKPKSIATVRPTVQNQQQQNKTNTTTSTSFIQHHQQRPTTSTTSTSSKTLKPLISATASTSTLVSKNTTQPETSLKPGIFKKIVKQPATIVKPEKIITKDPVNDPLNLDDLSEIGSNNYSLSDISGETYNSISDFDDEDSNGEFYSGDNDDYEDDDNLSDNSQIIEISNDSSGSRSHLEDLRASTPSPVISDDSDTPPSSSFGFKIRETNTAKPYSHPDIIESVLRKGEKPKLFELLDKYNLLFDSLENDAEEEATVVIDITTSRETLVENLEVKNADVIRTTSSSPPIEIHTVENIKISTPNPSITCPKSSNNTNNKSEKKKLKNMDRTNGNRNSSDSDLSAVEELLEESYAEAMKRMKDAPPVNQEVGAELEIGGEEEVTAIEIVKDPEENKEKLTKPGIVIDYDDNPLETMTTKLKDVTTNELKIEDNKIEIEYSKVEVAKGITQEEVEQKLEEVKKVELKDESPKDIIETENKTNFKITGASSIEQMDAHSPMSDEVRETKFASAEVSKILETVKSNTSDLPNIRKKKRFRNLRTPEPSESVNPIELPIDIVQSIDDVSDFIGFEEVEKSSEDDIVASIENVESYKEETKVAEEFHEKSVRDSTIISKKTSFGPFKSPTSSHKSLRDKHKEAKERNSRDSSKERSSKESKTSSSREHSKDKGLSSRESSKDRSSRGSSKDRSRESSKDRSKHNVNDTKKTFNEKHSHIKHCHKDHKKSSESKDLSKSKESIKSEISKELKETKKYSKDSHKTSSGKKDRAMETTNEKHNEKLKTIVPETKEKKDAEKNTKEVKSGNDSKKNDIKGDRYSTEKKGDIIKHRKPAEDMNKTKDKNGHDVKSTNIGKAITTPTKGPKYSNNLEESKNSLRVSSTKYTSSSSRDSSTDRKDIKKTIPAKSNDEIKKTELSKMPSETIDRNKSQKVTTTPLNKEEAKKPISSKVKKSDEKDSDKLKGSQKSCDSLKELKLITLAKNPIKDNSFNLDTNSKDKLVVKNATPIKPTSQISDKSNNSKQPSTSDSNTIPRKSIGDKKVSYKADADKNLSSKNLDKIEDESKKSSVDANKSSSENKEPNKFPAKSEEQKGNSSKKEIPIKKLTKGTTSNNSNVEQQVIVVIENTENSTNIEDLNTSLMKSGTIETKIKSSFKKSEEGKQKEKDTVCKKEDLLKQDQKLNISTTSEEAKIKESESNPIDIKTDKSASMLSLKKDLKITETKSKPENIETSKEHKSESIKTKKLEETKPDNINTRKFEDTKLTDTEDNKDVGNTTNEKKQAIVEENKTESIKLKQCEETLNVKPTQKVSEDNVILGSHPDSMKGIEYVECTNEKNPEPIACADYSDLKSNVENPRQTNFVKNEVKELLTKTTDSITVIAESVIDYHKKENEEAKTSKGNQWPLRTKRDDSNSPKLKPTVTTNNVEISKEKEQDETIESTLREESELKSVDTTSEISKKSEETVSEKQNKTKDLIDIKKSHETTKTQETRKETEIKDVTQEGPTKKRKSKTIPSSNIVEVKINKSEVKNINKVEISSEPMKSKQRDNLTPRNSKNQEADDKAEDNIEPRITRSRVETSKTNLNEIINDSMKSSIKQCELKSDEQERIDKNENKYETEEDNFEPRKTRQRTIVEIKQTNTKSKDISGTEISMDKDLKEQMEEHVFEPIKTRSHSVAKIENFKPKVIDYPPDKETTKVIFSEEKNQDQKRKDVIVESLQIEKCGELKGQETIKSKKRQQFKVEDVKSKSCESVEEAKTTNRTEEITKISSTVAEKKYEIEPIKTRRRGDIKTEDLKPENHQAIKKESTEVSNIDKCGLKNVLEQNFEPIKTRKRVDVKTDSKVKQKHSTEHLQIGITTDELKDQSGEKVKKRTDVQVNNLKQKEDIELSGVEESELKDQTDDRSIESVKTKKCTETEDNKSKDIQFEKKEKEVPPVEKLGEKDAKSADKKGDDKFERIQTRKYAEVKTDDSNSKISESKVKETAELIKIQSLGDNESKANKRKNIQEENKVAAEHKIKDSKQHLTGAIENIENLKTDAKTDIFANESSITSDNTLRRILRKRGTESPFPENDNKRTFKEPSVKSAVGFTSKSSKVEKPFTNVSGASLKRSLRSPVLDTEVPNTSKRAKLETSRKTIPFHDLHEDCLEEEELPVITADVSDLSNEGEGLNISPKAQEVEEKNQLVRKSLRREPSPNRNTEEIKESVKNDMSDKSFEAQVKGRKSTPATEKLLKKVLRKEVLEIEVTKHADNTESLKQKSNTNIKKCLRSEEVKTNKYVEKSINDDKLKGSISPTRNNAPERSKTNKAEINTSPNRSPDSSSVLSFSDWLKNKEQNTSDDENLEDNLLEAKSTSEKAIEKTKGNSRIRSKPITKDIETVATLENVQISKETNKQLENLMDNQEKMKNDLDDKVEKPDGLNSSNTSENMKTLQLHDKSLLQPSEKQLGITLEHEGINKRNKSTKNKNISKKAKIQTDKEHETTEQSPTIPQLDVQEDKSSDNNKITVDKSKATTPTQSKPKNKKSEIDLLIESMSKEMKEGGITDLLNIDTHVKRQRLSAKRNIVGSLEQLHTSATTSTTATTATTKEAPATISTTAGILSKEIPKVIEFSEISEISTNVITTPKETNKTLSKRKNIFKFNKSKEYKDNTVHIISPNAQNKPISTERKSTFETLPTKVVEVESSSTKSRKSLNPKELTLHVKVDEEFVAPSFIKLRRSMPQTKESIVEKKSTIEESTPHIKTRKSIAAIKEPMSVQDKNIPKSMSGVFRIPKSITHSTVLNLTPSTENKIKLCTNDNKRPQSRNKTKSSNLLKPLKCRGLKVRLNRSKVRKYWNNLNERNSQVSALSKTTSENAIEPVCPVDVSPTLPNNADSDLSIQSVTNKSDILDIPTEYNINNNSNTIFVPQDSLAQTDVVHNTTQLETQLDSIAVVSLSNQPYMGASSSSDTVPSLPLINIADTNEIIELKNEFMDENSIDLMSETILPDTPTLLARAQTITEAAQHALSSSIAPTDIRLLTTESSTNAYVPSFGITPTVLDNRGTCMYTFLHPAKYNRNHSNVLLDYCCPNLDGPMPAIDPTRIHAQVQVPVVELPASIVLTTKVVTRADLESENSTIPAVIRRKAEKIRNNLAEHHKVAQAANVSTTLQPTIVSTMTQPHQGGPPTSIVSLPPTINALTKQLPATTTITAKIRPAQHQQSLALQNPIHSRSPTTTLTTTPNVNTVTVIPRDQPQLTAVQKSTLRSNLRRFDVLLKQLVQPYDSLTFVDRHHIIEAIITTGKLLPKDLDRTLVLMEEYIKETTLLNNDQVNKQQPPAPVPLPATTAISTNNYHMTQQVAPNNLATIQMPQLQPSPNILASKASTSNSSLYNKQLEQLHKKTVRKLQSTSLTSPITGETGALVKKKQVPIYDTDRNIIGYQMKTITPMSPIPTFTKSNTSAHTGATISTSLDSNSNKISSYNVNKRPLKRPAQDSPRVFYTTPPLQASTPKDITNPQIYPTKHTQSPKAISQKTQKGSIVTTVRSSDSSSSGSSETITTTTMATVKRVTRSTATGSKIIIVSKSNESSEETILPDGNNQQQPEIKNEDDIEDFIA